MRKILSSRITLALVLLLSACASQGPEKRANTDEGPVSARARNALAAENPEGLVKVAEGFERSGNFEGAYNLFGQAMAAAPELLSARLGIARVLAKMGRAKASLALLEDLAKEYPDNMEISRVQLGVLLGEGQFVEARSVLDRLMTTEAGDGLLWDTAGRLAQVEGNVKRARDYFDRALTTQEGRRAGLHHLALSFALEGEYESAVALLQTAMDAPATALSAKRSLALVYALSGQVKAARIIAMSAMPQEEVNALLPIYRRLPRLDPKAQAIILMFDQIPAELFERKSGQ